MLGLSVRFAYVDASACAVCIRFDLAVLMSKLMHSKSRVCAWLYANSAKYLIVLTI